eukprot:COSAG03_NODE_16969_length_387_cov_0.902778_1_plen_117_part_10
MSGDADKGQPGLARKKSPPGEDPPGLLVLLLLLILPAAHRGCCSVAGTDGVLENQCARPPYACAERERESKGEAGAVAMDIEAMARPRCAPDPRHVPEFYEMADEELAGRYLLMHGI